METLKELEIEKREWERKIISEKSNPLNNRKLEEIDRKMEYIKSFIKFIEMQDLDSETREIILGKLKGENGVLID